MSWLRLAMQPSLMLGRVLGIPIGLHLSWFIIAALITLSLAGHFRSLDREWSGLLVWGAAIFTALLFFATLLAHELAHALVARGYGLPVRSITLFALGGVAQIERDADRPSVEFWIAIAGPIVSVTIGLFCVVAARELGWSIATGASNPGAAILGWLGSINIVLAVFNLIPGYPLDGGRLLRAFLWAVMKDEAVALRVVTRVGQIVAMLFIFLGVLQFFRGGGFGGLWTAFIGWFLLDAARSSSAQAKLGEALRGMRVSDVMARDCAVVPATTSLQAFVEDLLLRTARRCFVVTGGGNEGVVGLVTSRDIGQIERSRWRDLQVADVMQPIDRLRTVTPDTPATDALAIMGRDDLNQLPVMSNGALEGVVTRGQMLQLLQAHLR